MLIYSQRPCNKKHFWRLFFRHECHRQKPQVCCGLFFEIWQLCTSRAPTSLTSCAVPHPEVHSSRTRLAYRSYHLLWRQMRTGESSDAPLFCCDRVQWVFYRLCVIKDNPKNGSLQFVTSCCRLTPRVPLGRLHTVWPEVCVLNWNCWTWLWPTEPVLQMACFTC